LGRGFGLWGSGGGEVFGGWGRGHYYRG